MKPLPYIEASHGQAWLLEIDDGGRPHASIATWLVSAPWAHPLWSLYRISLIHLRPIEGFPPAMMHLPGATHELAVAAVHPDWQLETVTEMPIIMHPLNFAAQMIYDDDQEAAHRIELAVFEICEGKLNPDTDARQAWVDRFGANMLL